MTTTPYELTTKPSDSILPPELRKELVRYQMFTRKVNRKPSEKRVKVNKFANNALYLPIADVEMQLDEMFFGLWQTHSFNTKVVANEITGEIVLEVFHPVAQVWIKRVGAAAVQIQMKAGSTTIDVNNKIINTLVKDYPHLKSECIKNAAKSLGKLFGRDLNRTDSPDYVEPIQTTAQAHEDLKK